MTWLIPVLKDDTIGLGSDGAYACHYIRKDKVKGLIDFIAHKSYRHNDIKKIYQITATQFWELNIFDYNVLERHGRLVWEKVQ